VASPKTNVAYRVGKDVTYRELQGQMLFLLPGDRFLYTMNRTGAFIWKGVLRKQPLPRIVAEFAKHFGIDRETAQADVSEFVKRLETRKILERVAGR
jgi:hypothetical protein